MKEKVYKYSLVVLIVCIFLINQKNILLYTRLVSKETFSNSSIENYENGSLNSLNYFHNIKDIKIESIINEENSVCYKIKLKGYEKIDEISRILDLNTSLEILKLKSFKDKEGELEVTFDILENKNY
ncbi:hypothetical protein SH2C18_04980 [Clostridium sediminicola]|uniref:hypothetical protein n=1 Tax=Clostridium sediminicola TaxID=3114879 RepID=UPI0031F25177